MTTPTTLTTTQLQWLCALYERECKCGCHGYFGQGDNGPLEPLCQEGKCTGRIPLLEGVREPCYHYSDTYPSRNTVVQYKLCPFCCGLGWPPTEDAWRWLKASNKAFGLLPPGPSSTVSEVQRYALCGDSGQFFVWLEKALRPLAVNAAEAEKWVRENIND